jgi:hypothetical protein
MAALVVPPKLLQIQSLRDFRLGLLLLVKQVAQAAQQVLAAHP